MGYLEECLRAEEYADHLRDVIPAITGYVNEKMVEEVSEYVRKNGRCGATDGIFVCDKKSGHKKALHKAKRIITQTSMGQLNVTTHSWVDQAV